MKRPEQTLQQQVVRWFSLQYPHQAKFLHHSPNGGYRTAAEGRIFKSMGTRAGFPDLVLFWASMGAPGLVIELKADSKGKLTPAQEEWRYRFETQGWMYYCLSDFDACQQIMRNYVE